MERYVVFDVETPNFRNDRMSAIGVAVIENGEIVETRDTLINPETHFDRFNIRLTGITPEMVRDAPAFPALWEELRPMMDSGILVAHNAAFDLRVLASCLRDYQLSEKDSARYLCTVRLGRKCYPDLPNHRLDTLCRYLDIPLEHHRAGSDSLACAKLLLHYIDAGMDLGPFVRNYVFRYKTIQNAER